MSDNIQRCVERQNYTRGSSSTLEEDEGEEGEEEENKMKLYLDA
jgi:hypothetical protein